MADPAPRIGPPRSDPSQFALDIDAMTLLPLVAGGTVGLEVPGHVVIRVGGGVVPSAYVDAINQVGTGWGAYDAASATLVSTLLAGAMFLEFGLALRPAGTPGIEIAVSYAMLWTHRTFDMSEIGAASHAAGLDVTIDAIHGELAWQSEPVEHLYFRIAAGWAQAFDRHVSVAGAGDATVQHGMQAAGTALTAVLGRYAFGPSLGVAVGVRF